MKLPAFPLLHPILIGTCCLFLVACHTTNPPKNDQSGGDSLKVTTFTVEAETTKTSDKLPANWDTCTACFPKPQKGFTPVLFEHNDAKPAAEETQFRKIAEIKSSQKSAPGGDTIPSKTNEKSNEKSDPKTAQKAAPAGVIFNSVIERVQPVGGQPNRMADMSVARHGDIILYTGNTYGELSLNGGVSWIDLNPANIFPNYQSQSDVPQNPNYITTSQTGPLCCDQVVQYVPKYDLFIWVLVYIHNGPPSGSNLVRLAAADGATVRASNGKSWKFWSFFSGTKKANETLPGVFLGLKGSLDFPDISVGNNSLYWSASQNSNSGKNGLLVVKIPLQDLVAGGTIHFTPTTPEFSVSAGGSHLSQDTGDEVFWAGHIRGATKDSLQIFSWKESQNIVVSHKVNINLWPGGNSTTDPNHIAWTTEFPGNSITGAARSNNNVSFAWTAGPNHNFPNTHIEIAKIDIVNYKLINQSQIFGSTVAFAYPSIAANEDGEIGISCTFGGKDIFPTHGVGILGDNMIHISRLGEATMGEWGDYTTVRRSVDNPKFWDAMGYCFAKPTGQNTILKLPQYIQFGR